MNKFSYGGQAVIEGVMMKGKHYWAIAVRKANEELIVKQGEVKSWSAKLPILRKPIFRGCLALIETMILGLRSLTFSANEYAGEEEEELTTKDYVLTFGAAILLTIGIFIMLPAFIIRNIQGNIDSNILLNLIEGAIKVSFFILYIIAISKMEDIKKVFQYHGAEHKAINCYEGGEELKVENVEKYSPIHARCGTNFVLIVLFVSIFVFSFFGRPSLLQRIGIHLAILPLVAGLSYEIIRQAGKENVHSVFKMLALPGMALQFLTTRKPNKEQITVAIKALETVIEQDANHKEEKKVKQFPLSQSI